MPLRSFANFMLIMSRHTKELRGALGHGLCVNPPLTATRWLLGFFTNISLERSLKSDFEQK